MSAKYDLIGEYWDRQKIDYRGKVKCIPYDPTYTYFDSHIPLFDISEVKRKIPASSFINAGNNVEFDTLTTKAKNCKKLALEFDEEDKLISPILRNFYYRRLNEISSRIKRDNPNTDVVLMRKVRHENY